MIGTKIRKLFLRNCGNQEAGWQNGRVDTYTVDASGVCWWHVVYEGGDAEYMTKEQLHKTFVGRRVEKRFGRQYFYGKVTLFSPADEDLHHDLWKVTYNDTDQEDYTFDELVAIIVVGEEDEPLPPPLPEATNSICVDTNIYAGPPVPTSALMCGARRLPKFLPPVRRARRLPKYLPPVGVRSLPRDKNLQAAANHEANMERAERVVGNAFKLIEEGLKAFSLASQGTLTTNKRKGSTSTMSRSVFRRSHGVGGPKQQPGITTLLGGDARQAWPVVKSTDAASEFIKESEFYVAHRGDWDPWGPRRAGEDGLLPIAAFADTQHSGKARNTIFHLFEQCHRLSGHPRYRGFAAEGSFFYAGEYQRIVGGDIVEEAVHYNTSVPFVHTQWALAELAQQQRAATLRKNQEWQKIITDSSDNAHVVTNVSEEHMEMAHINNAAHWEKWSLAKRETAAWVELFIAKDWVLRTVAVECVGYNEGLYQKLVEIGASNGRLPDDEESEP